MARRSQRAVSFTSAPGPSSAWCMRVHSACVAVASLPSSMGRSPSCATAAIAGSDAPRPSPMPRSPSSVVILTTMSVLCVIGPPDRPRGTDSGREIHATSTSTIRRSILPSSTPGTVPPVPAKAPRRSAGAPATWVPHPSQSPSPHPHRTAEAPSRQPILERPPHGSSRASGPRR